MGARMSRSWQSRAATNDHAHGDPHPPPHPRVDVVTCAVELVDMTVIPYEAVRVARAGDESPDLRAGG
jgi:hypothetical protein